MPEKMRDFLDTVAEQIRWKKARAGLTEELATHLMEQREAYLADGMTEEAAEGEALRQMGDPVVIGAELDRIHRPRPQWGLLIFAALLLIVGALVEGVLFEPAAFIDRSVQRIVPGAVMLLCGYFLDVSFVGKRIMLLFPLFLTGTILLFFVTPQVNCVYWMVRQVMLLFPVMLAALMWSQRGRGWPGALLSLAGVGIGLCVAGVIPCTFSVILVIVSALVLGLLFNARNWFGVGKIKGVALTALLGLGSLSYLVCRSWDHWRYAFFPERASDSAGYFASSIRRALVCAKWLGAADTASWEAATGLSLDRLVPGLFEDALLVNLICRFGWLPFLVLMAAFAGFFAWAIWKTFHLRQSLGKAVAAAVLTTLLTQCAAGLLLTFGVPLMAGSFPLVVGNWASVLNMLLIGVMLSAFRDGALPETQRVPGKPPRYKLIVKLEKV